MHKATRLLSFGAILLVLLVATTGVYAGVKLKRPVATGKDFYCVFPKATWGNQSVGVLINSPTKQKVTITTPTRQKGILNIKRPQTTTYYGGQFRVESEPEVVKVHDATRIQSTDPITVHGQFGINGISGTYTALPVSAWGTEYYVVAPPEGTNTGYPYYPQIYSVPMITIIAMKNGTTVQVVPTATTAKGHAANVPYNVSLNEGDVYNITTQGDPKASPRVEAPCEADFSGTHLVSNFPIGVLAAQTHNTWPCGDNECGDYCVEYLPPVCNWDSEYVISPSVPRLNSYAGEGIRVVFGHDGTDLTVDDGGGPRTIGTFAAGEFFDYPQPLSDAIIMKANRPFLPVEITKKPANCFAGTSGGENWTLGMVVLSGVNQWGDYTPFSTAIGSQSVANIFFRYAQRANILLNGKPLIEQFPIVKQLADGYAYVPIPISAGSYNELVGDSGATAGGSIFGFGTLRAGANNGKGNKDIQDPEVIKSFCHPIGVNALAACSPDTTPPHITLNYLCGHWDITAYDDETEPPATGIYDIYLALNSPPDTSFNVQFNPVPNFTYGTTSTSFGIDIINLAQPAQAALHVRDGAGNEYDTLLIYTPQRIDAVPESLALGAVRILDTATGTITLINQSDKPAIFTKFRLAYGAAHNWYIIPPSPTAPFTIQPHDSAVFYFRYISPNKQQFEWDNDTLYVTTCKEFPIATLSAFPKRPAVNTTCYDFGNAIIDTAGGPSDSIYTYNGMYAVNIGTDTLHITNVTFVDTANHNGDPNFAGFPQSDYEFAAPKVVDQKHQWPLPTPATPWRVNPGDTAFVTVLFHPHHSNERDVLVYFETDANHQVRDTGCITGYGLAPGLIANNVDYGTHLYATTKDSFFVVKNTGTTDITMHELVPQLDVSDTNAFKFFPYFDSIAVINRWYDTSWTATQQGQNVLRGGSGDTFAIPYRFIARTLGANQLHLSLLNSSTITPEVKLTGNVIEPRVWGAGSCDPADSTFVGGTLFQTVQVGNSGTDSLLIESGTIGGPDAAAWSVQSVTLQGGATVSFPFKLGPNDTATVRLQFKPTTHVGPYLGTVAFRGVDQLGRHAADSATSFYNWGVFPYDTTVSICNAAFANGIAVSSLHLDTYVTSTATGRVWIYNTGQGPIDVTNISDVASPDVTNSFITYLTGQVPPFTIPPQDSVPIDITFAPNPYQGQPLSTGRRDYAATLEIENSTGTPIQSQITGHGFMVDVVAHIDSTYHVAPTRTVDVGVICDSFVDTLGLTDVRGFIYELIHYKRSILQYVEGYSDGTTGENLIGTLLQGAGEAPNPAENTLKDSAHLWGTQGYYELNFRQSPQNAGKPGLLFKMRFQGIVGWDTSYLDFVIRGFQAPTGQQMDWVNMTTHRGMVTVDSVCGLDVSKIYYSGALALRQNIPNPVASITNIEFEQPSDGHVNLAVYNSVGDLVARLVDQDLTKGTFKVAFDATTVPSGLYTYRLETTSGMVQKQMMIMH